MTPTNSNPPLASSIDPCRLLTIDEASSLNGVTYKGGGSSEPSVAGLSMCSWDNAAAQATVEVGFGFWSNATGAQAAYDAAVGPTDQVGLVAIPVAGLGDSASVVVLQSPTPAATGAAAPPAGRIYVRRGPLVIAVGYYGGIAPTTAALEAIAAKVLAELPLSPR